MRAQAFRPVPEGGTLGIFAGSGPFDPDRLAAGRSRLEARGFRFVEATGVGERDGFLAGADSTRAEGILELLDRDDVDGLIAARGGYGLTRILHRLPAERFVEAGKPVVGFSDVTALHAHVLGAGLEVVHGPVLTQLPALSDEDVDALACSLRGHPSAALVADGPQLTSGVAEGPLWGGNLAVLVALVGTPHLRPPPGGLLFIEDVGERTYRLDRLLTQLGSSGCLDTVAGFVLGDFLDCEPGQPAHPPAAEVLRERLVGYGRPILSGLPVGHGRRNRSLILGRRARLDTSSQSLEMID